MILYMDMNFKSMSILFTYIINTAFIYMTDDKNYFDHIPFKNRPKSFFALPRNIFCLSVPDMGANSIRPR